MRHRLAVPLIVGLLAGLITVPPMAAGSQTSGPSVCDPTRTPAEFRGEVPTGEEVLGFPIGSREVTTAQSNRYLAAVDRASPRVVTGTLARSWQGRPLRYAIIGRPGNVTPEGLAAIRETARRLRDPDTLPTEAARIAATAPAILWVASNIHGDEESGTDASLRVLYELADRVDCAARQILANALVVLLPVQNPDGREADTRRNIYGFDLNRDWFARTQRETDGKMEFVRKYPPVLFIDAHEMGGEDYFFPPNPDPIYHEITHEAIHWIDHVYGAAMAAEFERQGIPYWTNEVFDLFYMGYGDTVPATGFIAAGMTFEKEAADPIRQRTYEQYVTQWVSLSQGAIHKRGILFDWYLAHVEAHQQGLARQLEPNEVNDPGSVVTNPVPPRPVGHYFLLDKRSKEWELQKLVRRLQRMDVAVYRLTAPLDVPDFRPYGRDERETTLPAGTYWVPLAQRQKHWVQAMLNEDTYVPFPYFYDVTGWSNPLLMDLGGGYSGADLRPSAARVPPLADPGAPRLPANPPTVGLYQISTTSSESVESSGWLRYLLERVWHLPYTDVTAADIAAGELDGVDVLLVPNGSVEEAHEALGARGRRAIVSWVNEGGRYVGWRRGGAPLAARLGISTARFREPTSDIPGSLIRVVVDRDNPLGAGLGRFAWAFYEYDLVMTAPDREHVAVRFPPADHEDFFVSGFAEGEDELGRTAAVIDEPVGSGRTIVFSFEPNFRAFTEGTQRMLRNAILGRDPWAGTFARAGAAVRAQDEAAARAAATALSSLEAPLRITVRPSGEDRTEALVKRYAPGYEVRRLRRKVSFLLANPSGLHGDAHPYAMRLARDLRKAGIEVVAFRVP